MTEKRRPVLSKAIITAAVPFILFSAYPARSQGEAGGGPPWCGTSWACNMVGLTGKPAPGKFAGLSMGTIGHTGIVTGQPDIATAEKLAQAKCAATNNDQPCLMYKATNGCIAMAGPPGGDVNEADDPKFARVDAWTKVLKDCGNASCRVQVTACAGDDPRTATPFPLPPNVGGGKVDPAVVGTWEVPMNPGRWVWEIAANGTYEFHDEGPDGTPSHAGTFVANAGTWTLVSLAGYEDTDGGTYLMQGPNAMVMTGKLGTGTWQRVTATGR